MGAGTRERLERILRDGNLTVADLARWFDRPDPTVRGWVEGTHQIGGAQLDHAFIMAQIALLENRIRRKRGLPVPQMSIRKRKKYLKNLKEEARA